MFTPRTAMSSHVIRLHIFCVFLFVSSVHMLTSFIYVVLCPLTSMFSSLHSALVFLSTFHNHLSLASLIFSLMLATLALGSYFFWPDFLNPSRHSRRCPFYWTSFNIAQCNGWHGCLLLRFRHFNHSTHPSTNLFDRAVHKRDGCELSSHRIETVQ